MWQIKPNILKYQKRQCKKQRHDLMACLVDNGSTPHPKAATSNQAGLVVSPSSCSLVDNDTTLPSLWNVISNEVVQEWTIHKLRVHDWMKNFNWFQNQPAMRCALVDKDTRLTSNPFQLSKIETLKPWRNSTMQSTCNVSMNIS